MPHTSLTACAARGSSRPQRRAYKVKEWTDAEDFLAQLARLSGKLLKGGEPDLNTAARMVLYDWQRGKIPFFTLPPDHVPEDQFQQRQGGKDEEAAPAPAVEEQGAEEAHPQQLPEPAEAVTEQDAMGEAGARPEEAAAAARAARELLSSATALQARSRIPVLPHFFSPEDEGVATGDEEEEPQPTESEEEGEEEDGGEGEENEDDDEEVVLGSSGSDDEDGEESEEEEEAPPRKRAKAARGAPAKGGKRGRQQQQEEESDDDSAGYGQGGLSWEAVMAAVQVRGGGGAGLARAVARCCLVAVMLLSRSSERDAHQANKA